MDAHNSLTGNLEKRIGIFEYDWALYSFIKDFAIKLAEVGYLVDIFQKDPGLNQNFADVEQLNHLTKIRLINFSIKESPTSELIRKFRKLVGRVDKDFYLNPKNQLDRNILRKSRKIFDESRYDCLIGIEKKGLVWAGLLAQEKQLPLIYYSLELYLEDHPGLATLFKSREFSSLRKLEKKYHQFSDATIIQDKLRAEALLRYNEVKSTKLLYLPISTRGAATMAKSDFLVRNLNIDPSKKILLYYGLIQDDRFSSAMVKIAAELPEDIILVMHGYGELEHLSFLQSIAVKKKVSFSLKLVSEEEIKNVISSANIGLALYQNNNSNDRLAAFSSVKVAYYMQCGVPLIAFRSESFSELMNNYQCGEMIDSVDEIPHKAETILKNYDHYREQAILAYHRYYDLEHNTRIFLAEFKNFIDQPVIGSNQNI